LAPPGPCDAFGRHGCFSHPSPRFFAWQLALDEAAKLCRCLLKRDRRHNMANPRDRERPTMWQRSTVVAVLQLVRVGSEKGRPKRAGAAPCRLVRRLGFPPRAAPVDPKGSLQLASRWLVEPFPTDGRGARFDGTGISSMRSSVYLCEIADPCAQRGAGVGERSCVAGTIARWRGIHYIARHGITRGNVTMSWSQGGALLGLSLAVLALLSLAIAPVGWRMAGGTTASPSLG